MRSVSISTRIAMPVIALVTAIFAALAAASLLYVRNDLRADAGSRLGSMVERAAEDLEAKIAIRIRALELTAQRYGERMETLSEEGAEWFLRDKVLVNTLFSSMLVISVEGRLIADWPPIPGRRGLDVKERGYFKVAREQLVTYVSEPFLSIIGDRPIVNISTPVLDANGQLAAVLVGSMSLMDNELLGEVRGARIGDSGYYVVATRSGLLMSHPDQRRIMGKVDPGPELQNFLQTAAGWSGWGEVTGEDGNGWLIAYHALHNAPWVVKGRLPSSEAYAPLKRMESLLLAAATICILLIALLVPMLTRRSLAPLEQLRRQIDDVDAGRRSGAVDVSASEEIGVVARSFNTLLASRVRSEAALRSSETFHRALVEQSPTGILTLSVDGVCTSANQEWVRLTSQAAQRVIGTHWIEFVSLTERSAAESAWARAQRSSRTLEFETRFIRGNRQHLYAHVRLSPILEGKTTHGYLAIVEDIGPQREAHRRLIQEIARADTMLLAMRDAIVLVGADGRIDRINQAATSLLGWDETAWNTPLASLLHLYRDDDGTRVPIESIVSEPRCESDDWSCETPSFGRIPVEVRWYRIEASQALAESGLESDGGGVLLVRDVAERRKHTRRIAWEAMHDSLTGLANRRAFEEALGHAFSRFRREGMASSVLMIDLDRFKLVNDRGGHAVGDEMLRRVAEVVKGSLRSSDLPARLGGDEFAVLLIGCDAERANSIAALIRQGIEAITIEERGQSFAVGASVGLAAMCADDHRVQDVIARADAACYAEKAGHASGREFIETLRRQVVSGEPRPAQR